MARNYTSIDISYPKIGSPVQVLSPPTVGFYMDKSALRRIWLAIWLFSNIFFSGLPTEWHQWQMIRAFMLLQHSQDQTMSKAALELGQLVPGVLNICTYEGKRNWKKWKKCTRSISWGISFNWPHFTVEFWHFNMMTLNGHVLFPTIRVHC